MKDNKKHLFYLFILGIIGFMLLCATGCGGDSCETVECGNYKEEEGSYCGVSIPGCGACLGSSGCLAPLSCKFLYGEVEYGDKDDHKTLFAIDNRYNDGGCMGCGKTEQSCYSGCLVQDAGNWGCVYGSTESDDEHIVGCADGCGGCFESDGLGIWLINLIEAATETD